MPKISRNDSGLYIPQPSQITCLRQLPEQLIPFPNQVPKFNHLLQPRDSGRFLSLQFRQSPEFPYPTRLRNLPLRLYIRPPSLPQRHGPHQRLLRPITTGTLRLGQLLRLPLVLTKTLMSGVLFMLLSGRKMTMDRCIPLNPAASLSQQSPSAEEFVAGVESAVIREVTKS
jgi:hypothetical protein